MKRLLIALVARRHFSQLIGLFSILALLMMTRRRHADGKAGEKRGLRRALGI
jgi:hypothetical protein